MAMEKVIKEIKNEKLVYKLGYNLYHNKVYPRIEIYKDEEPLSGGYCTDGVDEGSVDFITYGSSSYAGSYFGNRIDEMFIWLKKYNNIPKFIEKEYEDIFIKYKNNDFKELRED